MILPRLLEGLHGPAKGRDWLKHLDAQMGKAENAQAYLRASIKKEFGRS